MDKTLTIVVPSYNTIRHIDNCLPTMIDERFIGDIEILLINDGSTDDTQKKLEQYSEKYPLSIRVINKENGGHGSVINRGIQEAAGHYFKVVDGDDPIITENLFKLVEALKGEDSDIVITPFYEEFVEKGERKICDVCNLETGKQYKFDDICQDINILSLHGINYKTSVLRENNIRVQEKCFYEDKEYILYPIPFIETLTYYPDPVYIYRIGVPGQSISIEKVIKNRKMLETITQNLCCFYERTILQGISAEKEGYLSRAICNVIKNMYGMFLKMPRNRDTMALISEFDEKCQEWSPILYEKCENDSAIRLIRKNNYLIYSCAYFAFKHKMKKRGF